jgi:hypothetical protein
MKIEISRWIFETHSRTKCNENTSGGSLVVTCGRTDGQTDMTKLKVATRNFANAPNNQPVNTTQRSNGYLFREP